VATNLNNLARLFSATNRSGEAERLFRRALGIFEKSFGAGHPTVASALNNLGVFLAKSLHPGQAEPLMRRSLEILLGFARATGQEHPSFRTFARNYEAFLVDAGWSPERIRSQLDDIRRACGTSSETGVTPECSPRSAEGYFDRGEECRVKEQWEEAIDHFSAAIRLDPRLAEAYFKRANIKLRLGRCAEAISDYTEAGRLDPNNAKYLNNRGRACFEMKQYDRAIADYDEALRIDPRFAVAYSNRGLGRQAVNDRAGAIADFAKSVELEPSNATYKNQLDAARRQRG
jgi:tetratricopeptide (TPR) repeat protein